MPSKKTKTYRSFSSGETKELGREIAKSLLLYKKISARKSGATVLALQGNLGAGKTTFVQGFSGGLGLKKRTPSPTFIIMRRHTLKKTKFKNLFHIDAYRLKSAHHLATLDFKDILSDTCNIVLIEWAERVKKILPKNAIWLKFAYGKKEHERIITIKQ